MKDKNRSSQDSYESLAPFGVPSLFHAALGHSGGDVRENEEAPL